MKRVLLISNRHPSEAGGRAAKFAARKRLLARHDWEVIVHTVPTRSHRILPAALRAARHARTDDVDVINSVSEPPQLHAIGLLATTLARRPWLAEFRDPLVTNPDISPGSRSWHLRRTLERLVLQRADSVVWFDGIQLPDDYFATTYPDVPDDRWRKLPFMGFEAATFEAAPTAATGPEFTLTYAGSFYDGWIEPYAFLDGLETYLTDYASARDESAPPSGERADGGRDAGIRVRFYGDWNDTYQAYAEARGVDHVLESYEFVPHADLVPVLKGSDALLHIGGTHRRNERNVPTKIWDYVGAGRPVLGVLDPEFRAAKLIDAHDLGVVADPGEPDAIAAALHALVAGDVPYREDVADEFRRRECVAEFAAVLDSLAE